jgi:hypothetical protein
MATIVGRDKRYHDCGGAHGFHDLAELIRTRATNDREITTVSRGHPMSWITIVWSMNAAVDVDTLQ